MKYAFLYDKNISCRLGELAGLNITPGKTSVFTNFSVHTFYMSERTNTASYGGDNDDVDATVRRTRSDGEAVRDVSVERVFRLYRFWCFEDERSVPLESAYFYKFLNYVNKHNPISKEAHRKRCCIFSPRKADIPNIVANYIVESRCLYTYM